MSSRLADMTAQAWLCMDPSRKRALVEQIITLSFASNIPTAHTTVVGFECTKDNYQKLELEHQSNSSKGLSKYAIGGVVGVTVLGGMVAAMAFGDIGATAANLVPGDFLTEGIMGIAGAIGGGIGGLGDVGEAMGEGIGECCGSFCEMLSGCAC